ncbi:MAG: hypothetical protein HY677_03650 [Chloroflexi bacterium]|nr:hypothetical protein [Chloroflexota bacterium]
MFGLLLNLLLIAGIIAGVAVLLRRRRGAGVDLGIGGLRRFYIYGLALAGLVAAGIGLVLLLKTALDSLFGPPAISTSQRTLALGLALAIVGTPIWLIFWSTAQRSIGQAPIEAGAVGRKLYMYLVLAASAITAAVGVVGFLRWAFGVGSFSGTSPALAIVWGAVWALHWTIEDREGQPNADAMSIRRAYVYLLALFSLAMLSLGVGGLLSSLLGVAYDALFGRPQLLIGEATGWNEATKTGVAMALVGGLLWWWHWHRTARGDVESTLRQVYLYLFAVLGGATVVVVFASILLYHLLQWFIGKPEATSARVQFDVVSSVIAAVVVGGGLWGYHWGVVQREAALARRGLTEARRVYNYLVAAVGLVTLGVGLTTIFAVAFGLLSPERGPRLTGGDWWRNPLVLAITLLAVGVPLWGLYWSEVQRLAADGGPTERHALSRRVFIYLIFFASVLLTLVNLSIALFRLFDALLGEGTRSTLLWDVRWNIGMLLTAGAVSIYYWLVLREDRQALALAPQAAAPAARRKTVTALVSEQDLPLVGRLEAQLGYAIHVWRRLEADGPAPALPDERVADAANAIAASPAERLILIVDAQGIRIVPYSE